MAIPDLVCIIDDDKTFTYILSRQMEKMNFCNKLIVFNNGTEALEYLIANLTLQENVPDLILLDLNMPVLDGWQFLDRFSKFQFLKKITVYIVSSSIDRADHEKALAYKQVPYFYIKPIMREHLLEMLEKFVL